MVETIFSMFTAAFGSAVGWFTALMERTGMGGIFLIAVVTVFAVNILLMPLRGAGIGAIQDATVNRVSKGKRSSTKNDRKG